MSMSKPLFPPQPMTERALDYMNRTMAARVPITGSLELTHRCNLACVHCYVNLPATDRQAQKREMTTEEVVRLIDELAEVGLLQLTITGGEPLLRLDFPAIYRHAHQKGILLTVYSNATLITDRIVELFQECPPLTVDITMYGYTPETYDQVADAGEGQWARWRRGLQKLLDGKVRVSLKTMAMKSTRHEVVRMAEFARSLGLPFRMDSSINPRIDLGRKPLLQRLTPQEVLEVEMETSDQQASWEDFCKTRNDGRPESDALYQCGAGVFGFLVDPYGKLHVCELSRKPGFDVVQNGFRHGWYEAIPELRALKREHDEGCGSCATHSACRNCVGAAELEGRRYEDGYSSYYCQVTDAINERILGEERPRPNGLIRLRLPSDGARPHQ